MYQPIEITNEQSVEELASNKNIPCSRAIETAAISESLDAPISKLLRYGVLLASAVVLIGGVLYLLRHGAEPANYQFFRGEPSVFCSPAGVMEAVLSGSYRGIIQLGLLLLVATPIVRVIFSLLAFVRQRDFTYIVVTLIVLSGLISSLIGAYI